MKDAQIRSEAAIATPAARGVDMKLEVVVVPVSDVNRAKQFYGGLGWRLDADLAGDEFHIIQFTPPGSPCSVVFGSGVRPGPYARIELDILEYVGELVVSDIEVARAELADRGVTVSEVYHYAGPEGRVSGPDPERRSLMGFLHRSGRKQLAVAGGHRASARPRRRCQHHICLVNRVRGRASACVRRPWRA